MMFLVLEYTFVNELPAKMRLISHIRMFAFLLFRYESCEKCLWRETTGVEIGEACFAER